MSALFSEILNMSLTGSVVIGFVLLARLLLKRAPKIYSYALWAVVLFRLLCPVSLSAPVGLLNVVQPKAVQSEGITTSVSYLPVEYVYSQTDPTQRPEIIEQSRPARIENQAEPKASAMQTAGTVWLAGAVMMALYSLGSYLRLRWQLVGAVLWRGDVWLADHIASPFVLGFLQPKIYLPSHIPMRERRWIVAHERHHIRRFDHITKLLAYTALCLHWFNPLAWAAFLLAGKDMEMSCDEAVIKKLGSNIRADYCTSLLRMATHKNIISGTPLAFGEGDTKGRVKNMAKWRRPSLWVSILCGILCIAILAACAVNPVKTEDVSVPEGIIKELLVSDAENTITYGDFTVTLPQGYSCREGGEGEAILTRGGEDIGGIACWPKPEISVEDKAEWVKAVGIPEAQEPSYSYIIDSFADDYIHANYVDEGNRDKVDVSHYLYIWGNEVYDLWFDNTKMTTEEAYGHRSAIIASAVLQPYGDAQKVSVDYSVLTMTMPNGCDYRFEDGELNIYNGDQKIGGVMGYAVPENLDWANYTAWLDTLVWERVSPGLAYSGSSSLYGDWDMHFESDVPPGTGKTVDRWHTFFFTQDRTAVYDVWFDLMLTDEETKNAILAGIRGENADLSAYMPSIPPVDGGNIQTNRNLAAMTPSDYFQEFTSTDGTVDVAFDANIPDDLAGMDISIMEAVPHYLTEADVKRTAYAIFGEDAVFTEAAPFFEPNSLTEKQLRTAIEQHTPYTDPVNVAELFGPAGRFGSSNDEWADDVSKLIAHLEEQLASGKTWPEEPCKWTFQNDAYYHYTPGNAADDLVADSNQSIKAWVEQDGLSYSFSASTRDKEDFKINNIWVQLEWPGGYSDLTAWQVHRDLCTVPPTQQQIETVKSRANQILQDMGLGYWLVDDIYVEVIEYHREDIPEYVIKVGAVPMVEGNYLPEIRRNQPGTINQNAADKPVENYYFSEAAFTFAPSGELLFFNLRSPMETKEVSRTNAIWSNAEMLSKAEEGLEGINIDQCGINTAEMGYDNVKCQVDITNIRVGMSRVRVPEEDALWRYVPALALYGKRTYTYDNGAADCLDDREIHLMTVSALDGSILHSFTNP